MKLDLVVGFAKTVQSLLATAILYMPHAVYKAQPAFGINTAHKEINFWLSNFVVVDDI